MKFLPDYLNNTLLCRESQQVMRFADSQSLRIAFDLLDAVPEKDIELEDAQDSAEEAWGIISKAINQVAVIRMSIEELLELPSTDDAELDARIDSAISDLQETLADLSEILEED